MVGENVKIKTLNIKGKITSVCEDMIQVQYKNDIDEYVYDYFIKDELGTK